MEFIHLKEINPLLLLHLVKRSQRRPFVFGVNDILKLFGPFFLTWKMAFIVQFYLCPQNQALCYTVQFLAGCAEQHKKTGWTESAKTIQFKFLSMVNFYVRFSRFGGNICSDQELFECLNEPGSAFWIRNAMWKSKIGHIEQKQEKNCYVPFFIHPVMFQTELCWYDWLEHGGGATSISVRCFFLW